MSAENISYDLKRFAGIKRDYTPDEVERLRGSIKIEYSLCKQQSVKLWKLLNSERERDGRIYFIKVIIDSITNCSLLIVCCNWNILFKKIYRL